MHPISDHIDNLKLFPDWESRYQYIIELADLLPPINPADLREENKVRGCTSQVWMTQSYDADDKLHLQLESDALIVKGLLALVFSAYEDMPRAQVIKFSLENALADTNLLTHLSPNRRSGFASVLATIQAFARAS